MSTKLTRMATFQRARCDGAWVGGIEAVTAATSWDFLYASLSQCATQNDRECSVEVGPCLERECIPPSSPCDRVHKPADAHRNFERLFESTPPRLEVGVAQP